MVFLGVFIVLVNLLTIFLALSNVIIVGVTGWTLIINYFVMIIAIISAISVFVNLYNWLREK